MGAKKKIQKEPKSSKKKNQEEDPSEKSQSEEHEPQQTKQKKTGKKAKAAESKFNLNFFSDDFNKKIDGFKSFYEDFLEQRGGDGDAEQELQDVINRVSEKLQDSCSNVLKEDLQDAEKWIEEQQQAIQKQIDSTESAMETTKNALALAGTFSESEIDKQVAGIEEKKKKLEKSFEDFGKLKNNARNIYGSRMDEE